MTKTNKKVTKKDMFKALLAMDCVKERADLVKFIEHEIELLDRKNGGSRKPTAQQIANEKIKEKILEVLVEPMTATQIMKAIEPDFPDIALTNQRISALLRGLGKDGTGEVEKFTEKRVTYFKKAEVEVEG